MWRLMHKGSQGCEWWTWVYNIIGNPEFSFAPVPPNKLITSNNDIYIYRYYIYPCVSNIFQSHWSDAVWEPDCTFTMETAMPQEEVKDQTATHIDTCDSWRFSGLKAWEHVCKVTCTIQRRWMRGKCKDARKPVKFANMIKTLETTLSSSHTCKALIFAEGNVTQVNFQVL